MSRMQLNVERTYPMPPEVLWPVISDLSGYADHVGGLHSTIATANDIDATRACTTTKGQSWSETIAEWEPGRRYRVEVDTSTYPVPLRQLFRSFSGTWQVASDGDGCRVTITFEGDVRRPFGPLVRRMARSSQKDLEETLESYGRAARSMSDR